MVLTDCKICKKKTFFNKNEFIKAHGGEGDFVPASPWVDKVTKKSNFVTSYRSECKSCKVSNPPHKESCKYYRQFKPIEIPDTFDWEGYWKWWFGVLSLTDDDLNSKMFFGKYE